MVGVYGVCVGGEWLVVGVSGCERVEKVMGKGFTADRTDRG